MTYYTSVIIMTWIALFVLAILAIENDRLTKNKKRVLCFTYLIVGLAALAEWLGVTFNGSEAISYWTLKSIKCADYILTPLAGGIILAQFESKEPLRTIIWSVMVFNTCFQLVSLSTDWMIEINDQNYYTHGQLYMVYVTLYVFMLSLMVLEYVRYGFEFRRQNTLSLFFTFVLIAFGIIAQEVFGSGIRTAYLGLAMGAAMLFIHNSEFVQMSADDTLKEQRFKILMSQIKPHFLYNTLGAIQELCESDPKAAAKATATFSRYLRGNMDSLGNTQLIPFEKELMHTRLYLDLEKMRFEDALQVSFDIQCSDFTLPALTLQPVAENAVRHGARGKRHGTGTVNISTREFPDRYTVIVEDNGPGFDPKKIKRDDDERSHIGIVNVRERLNEMCGGRLVIESERGKGTKATIVIPKDNVSDANIIDYTFDDTIVDKYIE